MDVQRTAHKVEVGGASQDGGQVGGNGKTEVVGRDPAERRGQGWHPRVRRTQVMTHLTSMQGRSQGKQASMQTDKTPTQGRYGFSMQTENQHRGSLC